MIVVNALAVVEGQTPMEIPGAMTWSRRLFSSTVRLKWSRADVASASVPSWLLVIGKAESDSGLAKELKFLTPSEKVVMVQSLV